MLAKSEPDIDWPKNVPFEVQKNKKTTQQTKTTKALS